MIVAARATNTEIRAWKLLELSIQAIYHDSFSDASKHREIVAEIPDLEKFKEDRRRIAKLRSAGNIDPELFPCYEGPLLSKQQEFHLFRKMNFLKWQAQETQKELRKLLSKPHCKSRNDTLYYRVQKAERYLAAAIKVRNQIASSNFRLTTMLVKGRNYSGINCVNQDTISDSYIHVLTAIDHFDFGRGIKFSTYATWVLKNNHLRGINASLKQNERFHSGMDKIFDNLTRAETCIEDRITPEEGERMVGLLFDLLRKGCRGDVERQLYAIKHYYGIGVKERRTLKCIAVDMGCTKERVRQLREAGLRTIREQLEDRKIKLEI